MSEEFDLKRSKGIVGPLYPILLDAKGKMIDGFHREEKDPDWPKRKLEKVKTERGRILCRIHANHFRRRVPVAEQRRDFEALAKEFKKEGVPKAEICRRIAESVPYTYRYVAMLLPDEYKRDYKRVIEQAPDLSEEEKSEIISQLESEPKLEPEPIYTGEDWECLVCGAVHRLFHIAPDKHKFDMVKEGKNADSKT